MKSLLSLFVLKVDLLRIWLALRSRSVEINRTSANRAGDATANMLVVVTLSLVVMICVKILYSKESSEVFQTVWEWTPLVMNLIQSRESNICYKALDNNSAVLHRSLF